MYIEIVCKCLSFDFFSWLLFEFSYNKIVAAYCNLCLTLDIVKHKHYEKVIY